MCNDNENGPTCVKLGNGAVLWSKTNNAWLFNDPDGDTLYWRWVEDSSGDRVHFITDDCPELNIEALEYLVTNLQAFINKSKLKKETT